jgi:hypothetical protein
VALTTRSGATNSEVAARLPGDDLITGDVVVMDRAWTYSVSPDQVWPWLVQLGKARGRWYFPRWIEWALPARFRGLRMIEPGFQGLAAGDWVPDYGPGDGGFRVAEIESARTLAYLSLRDRGNRSRWPATENPLPADVLAFSWVFHLTDLGDATRLHIRLRLRRRTPVTRRSPVAGWGMAFGGLFDWLTVRLMFAGLAERLHES